MSRLCVTWRNGQHQEHSARHRAAPRSYAAFQPRRACGKAGRTPDLQAAGSVLCGVRRVHAGWQGIGLVVMPNRWAARCTSRHIRSLGWNSNPGNRPGSRISLRHTDGQTTIGELAPLTLSMSGKYPRQRQGPRSPTIRVFACTVQDQNAFGFPAK